MANSGEKIIPVNIEEEMKDSYLDYSMSVIVSRALPDVRDGLKPVHRRILYGMLGVGLHHNKPYKKCARIVGEVLGKYHPHGDAAVYDALVRMTQDFSMRYPLIDGQGNFGSVDGDSAAAMRYTEAKMKEITEELLRDLDKNTVDFIPNFDNTLLEPAVLPAVIPGLLINGSSGIAVGMSTNIPPHNLSEVIEAAIALIDNPDLDVDDIMKYIKGPDFPTGAIICGIEGIKEAYRMGRGKVIVRARVNLETKSSGRTNLILTELPYQVNKSNLIEKIANLVRDKKIEGISDIRDESDRDGIRVVIELKKEAVPDIVLNVLYKHTQIQDTFGIIFLALVNGEPKILNIKDLLVKFINFRHDVVTRRTRHLLKEAEDRAHLLEGFKTALDHIDEIINLIKKSKDPKDAKDKLMRRFKLSEKQTQAILDMRLQRLTGLERRKIVEEYRDIIKKISRFKAILESRSMRLNIVKEELTEINEKYGDARRTEITPAIEELSIEDFIAEEDMVITISHKGFIKRFPVSGFKRQIRGGKGLQGAGTKDDDFIEHLFIASTHHYLMLFSDKGNCYWLRVHEIPQTGRASRGRSIINLINKKPDEDIQVILPVKEFDDRHYVFMCTEKGIVKKTNLSAFSKPQRNGIYAIDIRRGDKLIDSVITDGNNDIILGTSTGRAIRFRETDVRETGRKTIGVVGIRMKSKSDRVVGMVVVRREGTLMVVTEHGYGKRTAIKDYKIQRRGGKGLITSKKTSKTGSMISIKNVADTDDLMLITEKGLLIRISARGVRIIGRNTQGVKLIRLNYEDKIAAVAKVIGDSNQYSGSG
ncbi:MAG: DNA gyrase subunit A [Fidelibacterota bacterium]